MEERWINALQFMATTNNRKENSMPRMGSIYRHTKKITFLKDDINKHSPWSIIKKKVGLAAMRSTAAGSGRGRRCLRLSLNPWRGEANGFTLLCWNVNRLQKDGRRCYRLVGKATWHTFEFDFCFGTACHQHQASEAVALLPSEGQRMLQSFPS